MASLDVIRTLTIKAQTEGVDAAATDLQELAGASEQVARAAVGQEKATLSVERAYQKLQRQLDEAVRAQENLARVQKTLEQAQAQGLLTQQRSSELMQLAIRQYNGAAQAMTSEAAAAENLARGMSQVGSAALTSSRATEQLTRGMSEAGRAAAAANDNFAKGATNAAGATEKYAGAQKLARFELINLGRQIQDVGVSLASGQAALTVAVQQGSQIADVFATSGVSMGNFVRQIIGLITPLRAAVIGATALAAGGALIFSSWKNVEMQFLNLSERIDTPISKLRDLQAAAQVRGIDVSSFVTGMERFAEQVSLAQRGLGNLADLFRANGMQAGTVEESLKRVADLIANARTGAEKFAIAQAAGVPATAEWVRLLSEGSAGLQQAIDDMSKMGDTVDKELILKARAFDEAWAQAWKNFTTNAQKSLFTAADFITRLAQSASDFLDRTAVGFKQLQGLTQEQALSLLGGQKLGAGEGIAFNTQDAQKFYDTVNMGQQKQNDLQAKGSTITLEDIKAREKQLQLENQRISLLGDLATLQDKQKVKQNEIELARLKGVKITKDEEAALIKNVELGGQVATQLDELPGKYDDIEHAVASFADTLISGMVDGMSATAALGQALEGLGSQLISLGTQDFAKNISKGLGSLLPQAVSSIPGIGGLASAALGAGISFVGKLFGGDEDEEKAQVAAVQKAAEEARKAKEAWAAMADEVERFNKTASGQVISSLRQQLESLREESARLVLAAAKAGDAAGDAAVQLARWRGEVRLTNEFVADFAGTIRALGSKEFASAQTQIDGLVKQSRELSDAIQAVAEFTTDYNRAAEQQAQLVAAARTAALATLDAPQTLSEVATRLAELQAKAELLPEVLIELGLTAEQAAAAIDEKLNAAIDSLRGEFLDELTKQVNELAGGAWINQAEELADKVAQMRADAAALGIETSLIDTFYVLSAQKIVDSNELVGSSFAALEQMLGLADTSLHEFEQAIEDVAAAAQRSAEEIAAAIQDFTDQLFVLQQDQTTLAGQLAVFDLEAQRRREAEIAKGGQALVALEALIAQQRINIINAFYAKLLQEQLAAQKQAADEAARERERQLEAERRAAEERQRILEEAQRFLEGALRRISEFIAHFLAGTQSFLSPLQRLQAAQSAFATQYSLALSGNREALQGITQQAQDVIEAVRAYYGSSATGQAIIANLISQLQALPAQVSAEQFIVDNLTPPIEEISQTVVDETAQQTSTLQSLLLNLQTAVNSGNATQIANALLPLFNDLDTTMDQALSFAELQQGLGTTYATGTLQNIFSELDGNGNGLLEKTELIKAATQGTDADTSNIATSNSAIEVSNQTMVAPTAAADVKLATANATLEQIRLNTVLLTEISTAVQGINSNTGNAPGAMLAQLSTIASLTSSSNAAVTAIAQWAPGSNHAMGGWVTGGIPGRDSVPSMLMPNEFVVRAPIAQRNPWLEEFNRTGTIPAYNNDNDAVIAAIHGQTRAIVGAVKALIDAQFESAGIVAAPMKEANKLQRSRRGEQKVA